MFSMLFFAYLWIGLLDHTWVVGIMASAENRLKVQCGVKSY